ncbi:SRPBCC domain-containing protein [Leptospira bandrabouensis]|uniref:SRPBCC family protein n=1 Tax=Leptospira bandrabouensis TaxID=2484903 RepID=UPI00223C9CD2|nr:SRPBCC domain-containing protein [Leptospira bandrabouensis]MCW7458746.1 SRPBCC domain-containing protein [Leptospira bandrabouensis]MCW7478672.1 SRPBCC domain-containing protein [Leptospira bandrabouensis]MCW7486043.1 SRPBCC domain-containing protein [Leptospira bandrabouensis]
MNNQVLKVERKINAERKRLFQAWLDVQDFSRWFLSGELIGIESVTLDPRPGGKFLINMSLDGKILPHTGEYITIDEPNKLVFTWCSHATDNRDTLVTVTFTDVFDVISENSKEISQKPKTLVTLVHEMLTNDIQIKNHNYGWTSILEGLDRWFNK